MGGAIVLPEADEYIQKCISSYNMTPKEISKFYKMFQRMDKNKTGYVKIDLIMKKAEWQRNLMTDCILELLGTYVPTVLKPL